MKRILSALILSAVATYAKAGDQLVFKKAFTPGISWFTYALVLVFLLIAALLLAKRMKPANMGKSTCQVLEKKYLGNKTVVYVLDYQNQRFLLADNQHALTIQALDSGQTYE